MNSLFSSLMLLANFKRLAVNHQELQDAISSKYQEDFNALNNLNNIVNFLMLGKVKKLNKVSDPAQLPLLVFYKNSWGVLKSLNAENNWVAQFKEEVVFEDLQNLQNSKTLEIFALKTKNRIDLSKSTTFKMVKSQLLKHKKLLIDAFVAGIFINIVAVVSAFYSMQIYDRVVPTGAKQTLMVLTVGVVVVIILEFVAKLVRSGLYEKLVSKIDAKLTRVVYQQFLSIRLDKLPKSVGTLTGQMRGYESVRSFLSSIASYLMVDVPFVLFYILLIALIGGVLAFIPLVFFVLATILGIYFHKKIEYLAGNINEAVNLKTGLLVESIEGAETIKSGQGGWRMLTKWCEISDVAKGYELDMKRISDHSSYAVALFQQLSFISMVAFGSLIISSGNLTMGGLIACSILSGRVLAPVAQIPSHLVSWANTKASIKSLDSIWQLGTDCEAIENPIILSNPQGNYTIENNTKFNYGQNLALVLPKINIMAGEKIAILGAIGSGKTTLLRMLSGMYQPTEGKVLFDGVNLSHIAKPSLAKNIGFLQQDGRLFKGSLRDNLTLGLSAISDEEIMRIAKKTGLSASVIDKSDKGLDFEIFEGGLGLSGGQKQLVNLTRIFLQQPKIWLLDEPTASLDPSLEQHLTNLLAGTIKEKQTLILITHKTKMLDLVDRVIVVNNHQIVMDGNKKDVLAKLGMINES